MLCISSSVEVEHGRQQDNIKSKKNELLLASSVITLCLNEICIYSGDFFIKRT